MYVFSGANKKSVSQIEKHCQLLKLYLEDQDSGDDLENKKDVEDTDVAVDDSLVAIPTSFVDQTSDGNFQNKAVPFWDGTDIREAESDDERWRALSGQRNRKERNTRINDEAKGRLKRKASSLQGKHNNVEKENSDSDEFELNEVAAKSTYAGGILVDSDSE